MKIIMTIFAVMATAAFGLLYTASKAVQMCTEEEALQLQQQLEDDGIDFGRIEEDGDDL